MHSTHTIDPPPVLEASSLLTATPDTPTRKRNRIPLPEYLSKKHAERVRLKREYARLFEDANEVSLATTLRDCHEAHVMACCRDCKGHWYVLHRCRQRVCPICSSKIFRKRARFLQVAARTAKHPKLITLTQPLIKDNPRQGIDNLRQWFRTLRKHPCFASVKAGAYTIEVVPKPEGWHIHLHALVDADYIPYQQLWSAWKTITGNDVPQTDIRSAAAPEAQAYVAKYCSKSAAMYLQDKTIVDWYFATKGMRLFVTFGAWYNCDLEDLDPLLAKPDLPCVCPWCKAVKTTFLARDGPAIFGREYWDAAEVLYCGRDSKTVRLSEEEIKKSWQM